jgi:hypothetical protein
MALISGQRQILYRRFRMKCFRGIVAVAAIAACAVSVSAAGGCYSKGDKILDAGIGMWPFVPSVHFEIGVHDYVSVGGATGLLIPYLDIPILARGAFHPFNLPVLQDKISIRDKLDAYAGLVAGLSVGPGDFSPVWPVFGEIIGARFYMSESFGFYAEECWAGPGSDLGWISGGVTFKF